VTSATQTQRRAMAAAWASQNPVLDPGEFAFEEDTRIFKVGDGVTKWSAIQLPYIPSDVVKAKGDLVVYGTKTTELLDNNSFLVDTNANGVADGWTLVGDPTLATIVTGGQHLASIAGQTTSITRKLKIQGGYDYTYLFNFNEVVHGTSTKQTEISVDTYSDATYTTHVASIENSWTGTSSPLGAAYMTGTISLDPSSPDLFLLVTLKVYGGATTIFNHISYAQSFNGYVNLSTAGAVVGSRLYVDSHGLLQWTTTSEADRFAPYITSSDMAVTYKTKSAAATAHAQYLLATDATAYETVANAAIAHALHQYAAAAATDYYTPAGLIAAGFEPNDQYVVKTADQTVTNSVAYVSDTQLLFAMEANATYLFELFLMVTGTVANGMRISMLAPTSASNIWGVHAPVPGAGVAAGSVHQAVSTSIGSTPGTQGIGLDGTTPLFVTCRGTIFNGTTAGNMTLAFAQNSAAASTSCTIKANSFLRAIKIS
jgi:hypothetical protein